MARIIVVDDHHMFREGVATLIDTSDDDTLVGSLPDTEKLAAAIVENRADVVLMDLSLASGMSYDKIERAKSDHPDLRIVVLSMFGDVPTVERAFQAGADGYVLKQDTFDDLILAIRAAQRGGRFISPSILRNKDQPLQTRRTNMSELPQRQRQIVELLAAGLSNKEIAKTLGIALPTVKNHISALFRKFDTQNRIGLINKFDFQTGDSDE